jgi:Ala-tRNA(Pro) deacylase
MLSDRENEVYDVLEMLGIPFVCYKHPPVFTVDEAVRHWGGIKGSHCKNLFIRNKKGNHHYLVIVEHLKKVDLISLAKKLGEDRLSFASEDRLQRFLGLRTGEVSPFGLIHDAQKEVRVVIDQDLKKEGPIHFHPNINTVTVGIEFSDFEKYLEWCGNQVRYLLL